MKAEVLLRTVGLEDAAVFFEHRWETEANQMAAFPAAERQAFLAKHNVASRRVLEKCGFTLYGEDKEFSRVNGNVVEGYVLRLD